MSGRPGFRPPQPARLRQIVLATDDLGSAVDQARRGLGLTASFEDAASVRQFDLTHRLLVLGSAYLEIVAPLGNRPELPGARFLARNGPGGYMLDFQVSDLQAVLDRAASLGVTPVLRDVYRGSFIAQLHPRDFGTLLEADQITGGHDWHFDAEVSPADRAAELAVPAGALIAVPDPAAMARRWAHVFGGGLAGHSVLLDGVTIAFTGESAGRTGLISVDVRVPVGREAGEITIAGVVFRRRPSL